MTVFQLDVQNQKLSLSKYAKQIITTNSINFFECKLNFDGVWNNDENPLTKTIIFYQSPSHKYEVLITGNKCTVPGEVLLDYNLPVYVGLIGIATNPYYVITTNIIQLPLVEGADRNHTQSPDITPSIYAQLLEEFKKIYQKQTSLVDVLNSYADLQNYDTTDLRDGDLIEILQDETRGYSTTYYKWVIDEQSATDYWEYIGSLGSLTVSQHYDPTSENAQSGKAVAEAVANKQDKFSEVENRQEDIYLPVGSTATYLEGRYRFIPDRDTDENEYDIINRSMLENYHDSTKANISYVDGADNNLQQQIDAIASSSDVVDVVGTYAELQAYDKTHLKDNDIIKVLQDETRDDAITYYRWVINSQTHVGSWEYVGSSGPYYTKSETDGLLDNKADKTTVQNHINNKSNPHEVTKTQVGLGNVDNTSDLNKPISTATQTVLDTKADKSRILDYITYTKSNNQITITGLKSGVLPANLVGDFVIPETIEGYSVTSIGNNAFYNCTGITSVTTSDSVTLIGMNAFYGCTGLTNIAIPDNVTSIGEGAFGGCTGLTSITIPDSVTSIGQYVFQDCTGLTSITIPDSVTSIGNNAFYGCTGLTSVTIPDSVTTISGAAFYECTSLTSITIPDSVTTIGSIAFYGCNSITTIYYGGTQTQWNNLTNHPTVASGGTIYYNQKPAMMEDVYDYHDNTKQNITDLTLQTTDKTVVGAINEVNQRSKDNDSQIQGFNNIKQSKVDFTLDTTNKTIPTAINEVYAMALGSQTGIAYTDYKSMIDIFNILPADDFFVGKNIYVETVDVPDLWIESNDESTSVPYDIFSHLSGSEAPTFLSGKYYEKISDEYIVLTTEPANWSTNWTDYYFVDDDSFVSTLETNGYVQVGYYKLAKLETGKVDLENYYTKPQTDTLLGGKQNTLTAGDNVSISNDEISASVPVKSVSNMGTSFTPNSAGDVDIAVRKTVLDATLVPNTRYDLGATDEYIATNSFTLNEAKSAGQVYIRIGQFVEENGETYTLYNPTLRNITTGQAFDISMTTDNIVPPTGSSTDLKWWLRRTDGFEVLSTPIHGYTAVKVNTQKRSWRVLEYRNDTMALPAGDYELSVRSTSSTITVMPTFEIIHNGTTISNTFTVTSPPSSLTLTLPTPTVNDNYSYNDINVAFITGSTVPTFDIQGTYIGDTSYSPSGNQLCELSFKYVCGTWVLAAKESAISA